MFKGQPKGLYALALANTGERFGYYTMLAIFMLFLQAKFGFAGATASQIYAIFLALVYFMPVVGGWLAGAITLMMIVATGVILDYYDPESESCTELPNDLFVLSFMSLVLGGMISASDSLVMRMMRNWRHPFVAIPHLTIRLVGTATLTSLIVWVVFGVILRC